MSDADAHPETLISTNSLGGLLVATSRFNEANALLAPAEEAAEKAFVGGNGHRLASSLLNLGKARAALGEFASAKGNLVEAQGIFAQTRGPAHEATRDCTQALIDLYDAWHAAEPGDGHDLNAVEWRGKLAELQDMQQPATTAPSNR